MINFLEETLTAIRDCSYTTDDVDYVTYWNHELSERCATSFEQFTTQANFVYDEGFGSNEIALHLYIVFKDGSWLEREEYDGAEGWAYKSAPKRGREMDILQEDFYIGAGF